MTEPNNEDSVRRNIDSGDRNVVSRRAILKGTVTAMPAILTLQSGAALARSSNLISPAGHDAKDRLGRTLCLDLNSVYPAGRSGNKYDLGEPAYGQVWAINDRDLRAEPRFRSRRVSEAEVCRSGKPAYYRRSGYHRDAGWQEVNVPRGIVVSATALTSFAGRISLTNI